MSLVYCIYTAFNSDRLCSCMWFKNSLWCKALFSPLLNEIVYLHSNSSLYLYLYVCVFNCEMIIRKSSPVMKIPFKKLRISMKKLIFAFYLFTFLLTCYRKFNFAITHISHRPPARVYSGWVFNGLASIQLNWLNSINVNEPLKP